MPPLSLPLPTNPRPATIEVTAEEKEPMLVTGNISRLFNKIYLTNDAQTLIAQPGSSVQAEPERSTTRPVDEEQPDVKVNVDVKVCGLSLIQRKHI